MTKNVAVFGIGNVLIGDDAAGPSIIRFLESHYEFPPNVFLEDLGTPSLDLAARMGGYDAVIFLDAVSAKAAPGEIRQYTRAEIVKNPPSIRMSPHDPSLKETVILVELIPDGPSYITLIGIVPETLDAFGLSDCVRAAVPLAAQRVLGELEALGITPIARAQAADGSSFWDAA
ncbi:MAG: hydrogenase maturation protease [Thermoanaerobaculia bacterium]